MKRKLKYFVFLFLIAACLSAQTGKPTRQEKKEKKAAEARARKELKKKKKQENRVPENIETFPKNFLLRPKYVYMGITLSIFSNNHSSEKFNWKTASPGMVGGAIKIKKVYVSAVFKLPSSADLIRKYGSSQSRDINVNIQGRIVNWGVYYRDYKGFYLSDYQDFYPNWKMDTTAFPRAPNLHVIEAGMNLGFNFNKNFSLNAAFAQSERQKKSAGSFLLSLSERYQRIQTDTNIVPAAKADAFPNLNHFLSGDFLSTIISFGAGYQFVMRKFHFTPVLMAGSGIQFQNYKQTTGGKFWMNVPAYGSARAQVGYNGNNFFTNIIYTLEFTSIPIKESRIRLFHNVIEFGVGVRF